MKTIMIVLAMVLLVLVPVLVFKSTKEIAKEIKIGDWTMKPVPVMHNSKRNVLNKKSLTVMFSIFVLAMVLLSLFN